MNDRPKLLLKLTTADRLFEVAGWLALIALWIFVLVNYPSLPETIAIHFNFKGEADNFGHKSFIFFLPIVNTLVFALLTVTGRYPHAFNYPVPITVDNAERQYRIAAQMMRCLKFVIGLMFGLITFIIITNPTGETNPYSVWMLPVFLAMIFIPIIYFLVKAFKTK